MNKEEKLKIEQECLLKYSKAKMIEKYINTLEENKQLKETMDKKDFLLKSQGDELRELYEENERLKNLCDSYEEEHCEIFTTWCDGIKQMKVNSAYYLESMDAIEEMIEKLKNISAAYNR